MFNPVHDSLLRALARELNVDEIAWDEFDWNAIDWHAVRVQLTPAYRRPHQRRGCCATKTSRCCRAGR